ncbi:phosphoribosylglycinamide formyltransferase [Ningiella sp. W23]|uniref:phosphoribosylglycinamide formyltransferase n=1 Tax=Ningiella sp. W23 TaxID=3023715 RepID=UPI003756FB44
MTKRIVILVSGNGSNAQAIIDACAIGEIKANVCAVIANKSNAYALVRAKKAGIDAVALPHSTYDSREEYDRVLAKRIINYQADLVVLAGFMRILSAEFVNQFDGKLLNIHPSILPKYRGLNTHQRALDNGDGEHGASVHFVTAELDGGPIVVSARLFINDDDTVDTLAARVAKLEWQIYPSVIKWFCNDELSVRDGRVWLNDQMLPKCGMLYEH